MRISYIDGPRLRRSLLAACEYAQLHRSELNRINVFPVPDRDAGTNLALTVQSIADRLRKSDARDFDIVAEEVAQAAVLGARGNVGVMLSHFLLGLAERAKGRARITAEEFGQALRAGADRLQEALEKPVEGTILTVIRDTAVAALEAKADDFQHLMEFLLEKARHSLERTPELLPVLKKAGVVDAGAKGFVHLLEGVVHYIHGDPLGTLQENSDLLASAPAVGTVESPTEAERSAQGHLIPARRPVGIVTDSASDLPEEIIRAHGITVVPFVLVRGEEVLLDGEDITAEEFHRSLLGDGELATTSQPPPAAFLEAFQRAAEGAEEVVGVFLGSNLSGTFNSAEAAANRFQGCRVYLVDTLGASLLTGLMVLKATELAELGIPPLEIVEELLRIRKQSGVILSVDRLDRLLASGRVGRGQAWLAKLLRVKPILEVPLEGSPVASIGKAFGRKRVLPAILKILRERIPSGVRKVRFGIIHVGRPEILPEVQAALTREFGDVEILSSPATPVLATHTGYGTWAVSYLVED